MKGDLTDMWIFQRIIEKPDIMPKIIVDHDVVAFTPSSKITVYLQDESTLEIDPKTLDPNNSQLKPCHPYVRASYSWILFKHNLSGSVLRIPGMGVTDIFTKSDIWQSKNGLQGLLSQVE